MKNSLQAKVLKGDLEEGTIIKNLELRIWY